jgi:hypothetical protein
MNDAANGTEDRGECDVAQEENNRRQANNLPHKMSPYSTSFTWLHCLSKRLGANAFVTSSKTHQAELDLMDSGLQEVAENSQKLPI